MRDGSNESNAISYTTPKVGGFYATLFALDAGKTTADVDGDKRQSIFVRGDIGALSIGIGHQKLNTTGANNNDDVRQGISAQYNFGMAKVGVAFLTLEDDSTATDEKTDFTAVHVMAPVAKGISIGLAYNQYNDNADKATQTVFQAKYDLSKRTSVNFGYETVKTDATGVPNGIGSITNGIANAYVAGETTKGYALSVSHKF